MYSFRRFSDILNLLHCHATRRTSSYVQDVRNKMKYIRSDKNYCPDQNAEFLVIVRDKGEVLISKNSENRYGINISRVSYNELKNIGINVDDTAILLSFENGKPLFAMDLLSESVECKSLLKSKENRIFMSLRGALFHLNNNTQMGFLSKCHALLDWKLKHQFCSYCGNILQNDSTRAQKTCLPCKRIHYPPVNPVGITLVSNDKCDKVLLVRQRIHPPKMFTCIAGFIEPGESLEENVKREVAEEVGLEVCDIQYLESQHWALTGSSLMMGCFATATDENFSVDSLELEAADWFDKKQVKDALDQVTKNKERILNNADDIWVPPPGAIAHSLIRKWVQMFS